MIMRTLKLSLSRFDDFGACVSGLCLVHCVAMPVVLAFAPTFAHLIPGDEVIHRLLAMLVLGLACLRSISDSVSMEKNVCLRWESWGSL